MNDLADEILRHNIACHLTRRELRRLGAVSKKLNSSLALHTTPIAKVLDEFWRIDDRGGGNGNNDNDNNNNNSSNSIDYGFEIPLPRRTGAACGGCHTVRVSMSWRDQGHGDRKSSFLIVETGDGGVGGGRLGAPTVVYASGVAPHSKRRLHVTLMPRQGDGDRSYHLWYIVRGGVGHSIHLFDVTVQALAFGDPSRRVVGDDDVAAAAPVARPGRGFSALQRNVDAAVATASTATATTTTRTRMREEEEVDEDPEGARTRRRSSPRDSCELETILRSLERGRPVPQLPPLVMYLYDKCCFRDDSERKRRRRRRGSGASRSTSQPPLASNGGGSGGRPGERESDPQDWDDDASEGEDMDVDEDFDPSSFEW